MKLLGFLFGTSRRMVILAAIFGLISGGCSAALLAIIGAALKSGGFSASVLIWTFVALCLISPASRFISDFTLSRLGYQSTLELRLNLSRQILAAPLRQLERIGVGRLFAVLTDDVTIIINALLLVPMLFVNLAIVAGCLIYLGWLSFSVLLTVAGFMVIGMVSYQIPLFRGARMQRLAREITDALFGHFRALTEGNKELKMHSRRRAAFLTKALRPTAESLCRHHIGAMAFFIIAVSWGQILFFIFTGTLLFALPRYTEVGVETLTACTITVLYMMHPLDIIITTLPGFSRANVALEKVEKLGLSMSSARAQEGVDVVQACGLNFDSLELSDVTYTYYREEENSNFTLGPINLRFTPGELVFLIGGNGSGKTTLLKLLTGLYTPEGGEIRINGQTVTLETLQQYREHFAVVFSDYYLFESLLGMETENLDERAGEYLARLRLDHKVQIKDGVLSTTELSQGQRKRLTLLVAYLEDRPVYVFDEWAADQDPQFKEVFYQYLLPDLMARGKTIIVISHDDHYYNQADRIIKLDSGQIEYDRQLATASGSTLAAIPPTARMMPSVQAGAEEAKAGVSSAGDSFMENATADEKARPTASLNLSAASMAAGLLTFLFILFTVALTIYQQSPPRALGADAPPNEFSAARARKHLEAITQRPHPMGTDAHAAVRDYIRGELAAQGIDSEVQKTSAVGASLGSSYHAGMVENVVARVRGREPGKAILLMGHYDSVPTSFGASDDGSAIVSMLEAVRALRLGEPLKNDLIFLFADGEETGSLGAQAFIDQHPWAKDVGLVLNMEARGNSGPVLMFETSDGNGRLVSELADAAPHPVTNSLLYEIYRLLPNDTDLTVFKRRGYAGLNFAFINGHAHYHSLADSIEQLSPDSLQHQGANLLALTRHFGNADLQRTRADNVVFFSLFSTLLVHYSGAVSIILTALVTLLFIATLIVGFRKGLLSVGGILAGWLALLVSVIFSALVVTLIWRLIRLLHTEYGWIPQGITYNSDFYVVSFVALVVAATAAVYMLFRRKVREANLLIGGLLWWALLMIASTVMLRGASYIFTWPLLFALIAAFYLFMAKEQERAGARRIAVLCICSICGIALLAPLIYLIFSAMPLDIAGGVSVLVVLLLGLLIPHLSLMTAQRRRWWLPGGLALVALIFILAGSFTSGFSRNRPKPNNIFYSFNAQTGKAIWGSSDEQPDEWTQQFFSTGVARGALSEYVPSRYNGFLRSDAPVLELPSPNIDLLEDRTSEGARTLRLRVTSPRQAPFISLELDPQAQVSAAELNGTVLPPNAARRPPGSARGWTLFYFAAPPEGFELSLTTSTTSPVKIVLVDQSYELPASLTASLKPRPDYMIPTPYPYNPFGDSTFVTRSFTF